MTKDSSLFWVTDHYAVNLFALVALCFSLLACQPSRNGAFKPQAGSQASNRARHPQANFYWAYALAMASDWLQGPYLYSLYRDEHGLSPSVINQLFTTGFLAGAASGYFVGTFSDHYGRKTACFLFCVLCTVSCWLTTIPSIPILFLGRVFGGISTSILFSAFDSFVVADFHSRGLSKQSYDLSQTFGIMSTINSMTAIGSGIISEGLVNFTGTKKSPLLASIVLLCIAMQVIWSGWTENYGSKTSGQLSIGTGQTSIWSMLMRPSILTLGLVSTMFEGSMYLFVFFWNPALISSKESELSLPLGVIFSCFMASVMASSLSFNLITHYKVLGIVPLLTAVLAAATLVLACLSMPQPEQYTFWLFCVFEGCVGMYWPCIGYLKGMMVEDEIRARVYGIFRIPLNVFVVLALHWIRDTADHGSVFLACSILVAASVAAVGTLTVTEK